MKNKSTPAPIYNGIGTGSALGIAFVVLKLMKIIDWSWWWVLFPFYVSVLLLFIIYLIIFLYFLFGRDK